MKPKKNNKKKQRECGENTERTNELESFKILLVQKYAEESKKKSEMIGSSLAAMLFVCLRVFFFNVFHFNR